MKMIRMPGVSDDVAELTDCNGKKWIRKSNQPGWWETDDGVLPFLDLLKMYGPLQESAEKTHTFTVTASELNMIVNSLRKISYNSARANETKDPLEALADRLAAKPYRRLDSNPWIE